MDIKGEKDFFGNPDWDPATSMTLVYHFCHMSSVRSTSDGRGPVTRKRVPDREEPGKPPLTPIPHQTQMWCELCVTVRNVDEGPVVWYEERNELQVF